MSYVYKGIHKKKLKLVVKIYPNPLITKQTMTGRVANENSDIIK